MSLMLFRVDIEQVQHVKRLTLELDLSDNKLTCIVGRNGTGKTTLVKAIRNLIRADTFLHTAAPGIFSPRSKISYQVDAHLVEFSYDENLRSLNCKAVIPSEVGSLCAVELPMPHGERFNFFQTVSKADGDIRRQIILEEYQRPDELIEFLSNIYSSDKFNNLVETKVSGRSYFSILLDNGRYVREDYLSSGEYFLINLYRTIKGSARLIVVDEIDLSLDAAAQVHLLKYLRKFCIKYSCNVLFTTHSLAMMRTLNSSELLYMELNDDGASLTPASYSFIKTLLFGFTGWDKYILTEDAVLADFIESVIRRYCRDVFFKYKIIHIGGATQVCHLLIRNEGEHFLADPENVIAVLDGDQKGQKHAGHARVFCTPIPNVESALHNYYADESFPYRLAQGKGFNGAKDLLHSLIRDKIMSLSDIHSYLCDRNEEAMGEFGSALRTFLSR